MSALVCPGCKAPIDPSWKVCQSCKQPLATFINDALEAEERRAEPSSAPRWLMFGAAGLFAAGVAGFMIKTWKAAALAPLPAPALPSASQALAEPASGQAVVKQEAIPKQSLWKFEGSVYGLRDAKPAAGVEVRLERAGTGEKWSAKTDAAGRYAIEVPVALSATLANYNFSLWRGGKPAAYIEDEPALPYRGRTRAQREEILEQTRRSAILHTPVSPDSTLTTQDFALLP